MKITLKDFQETTVERLYAQARLATSEAARGYKQALVLSSPTGSGKTVIATALMERIAGGDGVDPPDRNAVFLWLSDQPDLNEQSLRKILAASTEFAAPDLITIDSSFDEAQFEPGKVYFLNIQKLGSGTHLVTPGDERNFTMWETIANTVEAVPGSFWLILDEAHKGMVGPREAQEAATIVQKFIKGSAGEIPAVPLIFGISATPERFFDLLRGVDRNTRSITVDPDDVRASGLLKETIVLFHPTEKSPTDWSLLRASAEKLKTYRDQWQTYCHDEGEPEVDPILVVQVEDGPAGVVSRTDLSQAIEIIEDVIGPLSREHVAHSFQEGYAIEAGDRAVRYISPADIQDDNDLVVVFFKRSLNTGWDCPRAEVIMSFRRAVDYTLIAQLVGRLVRTPLARSILANDFLNSVTLYLPHYDSNALNRVVDYLTSPETGVAAPPEIIEGDGLVELRRDSAKRELFELAAMLPTYGIERVNKISDVRRLIRLGRALTFDKLDQAARERFTEIIIAELAGELARRQKTTKFKNMVRDRAGISVRRLNVAYGSGHQTSAEETLESVAVVSQNIDDLHAQSGRKLGEGLHAAYLKARIANSNASPPEVKLELRTLLDGDRLLQKVEERAGQVFREELEKHKAAIRGLPEGRQEVYRKLRRQAARPEPEELELPEILSIGAGQSRFRDHLYLDESRSFTCQLDGWESSVMEDEASRGDLVGWLRNVPRKKWAFTIPYSHHGQDHPLYPDFLIFRRQGDGIVVDILEPHWSVGSDSAAKAKGMAEYAARHGDQFGRIELIVKEGDRLRRLDVNRVDVRDAVRAVSGTEHLRQLFETFA